MRRNLRLGDILVAEKVITEEQLMRALDQQKGSGKKLGEVLMESGLLTEEILFKILGDQFGIPYVDLSILGIDPKVPKMIPEAMARKYVLIPIKMAGNHLTLAMSDPLDIFAKDDARLISGMEIQVVISQKADILNAINRYYDSSDKAQRAIEDFRSQSVGLEEDTEEEDADVANAPIVRLVNTIISQAVKSKASDIHIEPYEKHLRIRLRIDGELREFMSQTKAMHAALVTRIKIMGKMNISEKRIPQDGRVETMIDNFPIDMRISILPTVYGEKVVIRLLDRNALVVKKEQLGFSPYNMEKLNKMLLIPEGIILVTGPTGSGKTTTLYTILKELNQVTKNIITVEDPVEYRLEGINQVQVNAKAGLTFASGLRSILRQDPDIVMVGEIRDQETAEIAVRASITGHIVLSTIHTNDTISTIARLTDMGIPNYLVSSALVGIIAQRLVKRICPKCGRQYEASKIEKEYMHAHPDEKVILTKGEGCNACGGTGYKGRTAIHEVLLVDHVIKDMISAKASEADLLRVAQERGLVLLNNNCAELVRAGITTVEELVRLTYNY